MTTTTTNPYVGRAEALAPEARRLRDLFRERWAATTSSTTPDWQGVQEAMLAAHEVCVSMISMLARVAEEDLDLARTVVIPQPDGDMVVASFEGGVLTLTEDGEPAIGEWHTGETTGESVRYERWTSDRKRPAHGYVDPTSRRITQTG